MSNSGCWEPVVTIISLIQFVGEPVCFSDQILNETQRDQNEDISIQKAYFKNSMYFTTLGCISGHELLLMFVCMKMLVKLFSETIHGNDLKFGQDGSG